MAKDNELLASVSDASIESEFFSPFPPGYKKGKTKCCRNCYERPGQGHFLVLPCETYAG
jgi:hypothetical protein